MLTENQKLALERNRTARALLSKCELMEAAANEAAIGKANQKNWKTEQSVLKRPGGNDGISHTNYRPKPGTSAGGGRRILAIKPPA